MRIFLSLFLLLIFPITAFADVSLDPLTMPSASDQSVIFLSYVFGVVNGVLHGSGSQIMGQMFAKFNAAVLALAGVVIVYTTLMGILNTAAEGEFLGKKFSSIFVPLRTVLGILLIAPTATGYSWIQVIAMWIVLQGVSAANNIWGAVVTYLADQGGAIIVQNQALQGTNAYDTGAGATIRTQSIPDTLPNVVCLNNLQRAIDASVYTNPQVVKPANQSAFDSVIAGLAAETPSSPTALVPSSITIPMPNFSSDDPWAKSNGVCGNLTIMPEKTKNLQGLLTGVTQVLLDLEAVIPQFAGTCDAACYKYGADASYTRVDCPAGTFLQNDGVSCPAPTSGTAAACQANGLTGGNATANPYGLTLDPNTKTTPPVLSWCTTSVVPSSTNPAAGDSSEALQEVFNMAAMDFLGLAYQTQDADVQDPARQGYIDQLHDSLANGWFSAGAYYFVLLQMNEGAQIGQAQGTFTGKKVGANSYPQLTDDASTGSPYLITNFIPPNYQTVATNYFISWLFPVFSDTTKYPNGHYSVITNFEGAQNPPKNYGHQAPINFSVSNFSGGGLLNVFLNLILPGFGSMMTSFIGMLTAQQTNANPLILMMTFGSGLLQLGFTGWAMCFAFFTVLGAGLGIVPSVTVSDSMTTAAILIMPLIMGVFVPMMASGAMLLFYLPAVPFMIFTFGTIGWIVGVVEAMVAAPIVAYGIMHPDGGHDLFGRSDPALNILLNLFLRPPLMIFGLVAGIMVSYIGVWIINDGFAMVVRTIYAVIGENTGSLQAAAILFLASFVLIPIIYLMMVMQVINRSFTLIYLLPDRVTRWLSGGFQESFGSEFSGDEGKVKESFGRASQSFGEGAKSQAKEGGDQMGGEIKRRRARGDGDAQLG